MVSRINCAWLGRQGRYPSEVSLLGKVPKRSVTVGEGTQVNVDGWGRYPSRC